MKDEKKVNKAEEVKEEKGIELTDEELVKVSGGAPLRDPGQSQPTYS